MNIELNRTSRASFDYVVGLRQYISSKHSFALKEEYEKQEQQYTNSHNGEPITTLEQVGKILKSLPEYKLNRVMQEISNQLMWDIPIEALTPDRTKIINELNQQVENPIGSIQLNSNIELPKYYSSVEFHNQPGSYFGDELAGLIYDLAVPLFNMRSNDPDDGRIGRVLVSTLPQSNYKKILDMGCGIGQKTIPIVDAFPDADVYAVDIAAPMIKYGHKRAERMGRKIHFSQQNVEATNFENNSFDLVVSTILLHELPPRAIHNMVAESYRVLKPGGIVAHLDIPPYKDLPLYTVYLMDERTRKGEPYWKAFHEHVDLPSIYREAGISDVTEVSAESSYSSGAGFFSSIFPYLVTMGKKH